MEEMLRSKMERYMREDPHCSVEEAVLKARTAICNEAEVALTCSMTMNFFVIDKMLHMVERLRASHTEEGRDRYAYDRDYTRDGQTRAVINATEARARSQQKELGHFITDSGQKASEKDFDCHCAESMDVFDEAVAPLFNALVRLFIAEQIRLGETDDVMMRADLLATACMAHVNTELYCCIVDNIPVVGTISRHDCFKGRKMCAQVDKLVERLGGRHAEALITGNKCREILQDLSYIIFSTEMIDLQMEARGCKMRRSESTSFVTGFKEHTMSLNYYRQHYNGYLTQKDILTEIDRIRKKRTRA